MLALIWNAHAHRLPRGKKKNLTFKEFKKQLKDSGIVIKEVNQLLP